MRSILLVLFLSLAACGGDTVVEGVNCKSNTDCALTTVTGTCQSDGFCAYPDATCAGGSRYSPGAGTVGGTCVGGDVACGMKDQPCCGTVCGGDLACTDGTCSCGGMDEPCCGGATCSANFTCAAGAVCACGAQGEACCGGTTCDTGLSCGAGTCGGTITAIEPAKGHTCVLTSGNDVYCWGTDALPYGRSRPAHLNLTIDSRTPVKVMSDVVELHLGDSVACARKSDNTLWCWGHNENGQLGNGGTVDSATPVQVAGLTAVTRFDVGRMHACAVGTFGGTAGLYCWGRGGQGDHLSPGQNPNNGRLGNGSVADQTAPTAVDLSVATGAGQTIVALAVGGYSSCIVTSDNMVWCWGNNSTGVFGNNTTTASSTPTAADLTQITIPVGVTITDIILTSGFRNYSSACMRLSEGTVYCWGNNQYGQVGAGAASNNSVLRPALAVLATGFGGATLVSLAATQDAFCGRDSSNLVWCWGRNKAGEIGSNDTASEGAHATPVQTMGLTAISKLGGGHHTMCAIDSTNHTSCWGGNRRGEITKTRPSLPADATKFAPVPVTL